MNDLSGPRYNLLTADAFANGPPHDVFDELRRDDPLHEGFTPDGRRVWSLTRYADIREVSNNPKLFTSSWGPAFIGARYQSFQLDSAIMMSDAPYHTRLRHFFNLGFTPRVTKHFDTWIREIVRDILTDVRDRADTFDFLQEVSGKLPAKVIGRILGMPKSDLHLMLPWAQTILRMTEATPEAAEAAIRSGQELVEYTRELRSFKARHPGDDMISMLADATYEGEGMTDREFEQFIHTSVSAGLETTFTTLSQSSLALMDRPDLHDDFRANHGEIMSTALTELLRYITPAMQMSRVALGRTEMHGKTIAREEEIIMWYAAANRDPAIFGDTAHQINLRRKNPIHVTFGAGGPHFCIGNHLARMQMQIFFEELFAQGVWFERAGDIQRMRSVLINGLRALPVRIHLVPASAASTARTAQAVA